MISKNPLKILWLDTETTGLDARRHDVIQIAGILDIDTIAGEKFNYYVQPFNWDVITEEATSIHGFTRDTLKTFEPPQVVHQRLIGILEAYINKYDPTDKLFIAGQNPSFDLDFLKGFWEKNDDPYFGSWFNYRKIDLATVSVLFKIKGIIDPTTNGKFSVSLAAVAAAFGLEQKEPHNALDDVRLVRKIFYEHMLDRFF